MRRALCLTLLIPALAFAAGGSSPMLLRVMTYNIHSCKGRDGKVRPDRVAEVIRAEHPDIVALQEICVGRVDPKKVDRASKEGTGIPTPPAGEDRPPPPTLVNPRTPSNTRAPDQDASVPFTDQPRAIARANNMSYVFYPLVRTASQDFGIGLLSRYPIHLVRAENLPTKPGRWFAEKRGAIWAEVTVDGRPVQILSTHLGLGAGEREDQMDALLSSDWTSDAKFKPPFILCGDLNSTPAQSAYKRLASRFVDAAVQALGEKAQTTWPSVYPFRRIDHIFLPPGVRATNVEVIKTDLSRISSDHLPLVADVAFR